MTHSFPSRRFSDFLYEFKDSSPDFGRYAIEWGFGDVYSRTDLDLKTRELVIIAAGAALGPTGIDAIKFHVPAAVRAGATRDQIFGVLTTVAIAAGVPPARPAITAPSHVLRPHSQVADDDPACTTSTSIHTPEIQ